MFCLFDYMLYFQKIFILTFQEIKNEYDENMIESDAFIDLAFFDEQII